MRPSTRFARALLVCAFFLTTACGGCDGGEELGIEGPVTAPAAASLALSSQTGCALDADCAVGLFCFQSACVYECNEAIACDDGLTCTGRGQCVTEAQVTGSADPDSAADGEVQQAVEQPTAAEGTIADYYSGVAAVLESSAEIRVISANDSPQVVLALTGDVPDGNLPYRIIRSDGQSDEQLLQRVDVVGGTATIPLDIGLADPTLPESSRVVANIQTPAGSFRVALVPSFAASGSYVGTANVATFGRSPLPMEFEIVTEPRDASLEEADEAWLLLPVRPDALFSPMFPDGRRDHVAVPLEFDAGFTGLWIATFRSAFDLGADGIWNVGNATQVERLIRIELEVEAGGRVSGAFRDQWTGLYDTTSAQGVTSPESVLLEGGLDLRRVGDARPIGEVDSQPTTQATPAAIPAPVISSCSNLAGIYNASADVDGVTYDCATISNAAEFGSASPAEQAACAVAVGETALGLDTTAAQIRAFLDGSSNAGQSFEDFLTDCSAQTDGACVVLEEILCARNLLGRAYYNQPEATEIDSQLLESYLEVAREASLGEQLGAFGTDTALRKEWLETTDYPTEVATAVQDLNEQLLDEWKENVLDRHIGVLSSQFDPAGLAVMTRDTNDAAAGDARQRLLMEMAQSWRAAMESLTLATVRWNTLLQAEVDRDEKAAFVANEMFRLYVSAAALQGVALKANAGFVVGGFGSGFSSLVRELNGLGQGFDERVYARDGEVVVNTSLDPQLNENSILSRRQAAAETEIDEAATAISTVLAQTRAEALQETELRNRLNNQIDDLRTELVELCGLPLGCSIDDWAGGAAECQPNIAPGRCGFPVDQNGDLVLTEDPQPSEAGAAQLGFTRALLSVNIANADIDALGARVALQDEERLDFQADVEEWDRLRRAAVDELKENIEKRQTTRSDTWERLKTDLAEQTTLRQNFYIGSAVTYANWDQMRTNNASVSISDLSKAVSKRQLARRLGLVGDAAVAAASVAAAAIPSGSTPGEIAAALTQSGTLLAGYAVQTGLAIGSEVLDSQADQVDIARETRDLLFDAELAAIQDQSDLETLKYQQTLEAMQNEARLLVEESDDDIDEIRETIELARAALEAELAWQRDSRELERRLVDQQQMLTEAGGLFIRQAQAESEVSQQALRYDRVVQTALLRESKLIELERQRDNINQLVGSPAAIFSRANELQRAERKLELAKDAVMNWLVALEYFAVRPFMDQRLKIILARNTYQLEAIADELAELQADCGGPVNAQTTVLSVRDDFMGLSLPISDAFTGEEILPGERFRRVLSRGLVPVDKRVRYSSDATVGGLLKSNPDILSGTFFIDLGDFANLELTCNAKVQSVRVNLVGEELGDARPTVTLLYDGTATLQSCQPNIEEYVAQFGPNTTTFGRLTELRTPGRSMSPVASIGGFTEDATAGNATFAGLPLSTQYTVLIDRGAGENGDVNWANLEDVEIELTYTYQDVFPEGQCE